MNILIFLFLCITDLGIDEVYVVDILSAASIGSKTVFLAPTFEDLKISSNIYVFSFDTEKHKEVRDGRINPSIVTQLIALKREFLIADNEKRKFTYISPDGDFIKSIGYENFDGTPPNCKFVRLFPMDNLRLAATFREYQELKGMHLGVFHLDTLQWEHIYSHEPLEYQPLSYWVPKKDGWLLVQPETGGIHLLDKYFGKSTSLRRDSDPVEVKLAPFIVKSIEEKGLTTNLEILSQPYIFGDGSLIIKLKTYTKGDMPKIVTKQALIVTGDKVKTYGNEFMPVGKYNEKVLLFNLKEQEFSVAKEN